MFSQISCYVLITVYFLAATNILLPSALERLKQFYNLNYFATYYYIFTTIEKLHCLTQTQQQQQAPTQQQVNGHNYSRETVFFKVLRCSTNTVIDSLSKKPSLTTKSLTKQMTCRDNSFLLRIGVER